jgi:hypothetical protein
MKKSVCVSAGLLLCFASIGAAAGPPAGGSPVALRIGSKVVREAQLESYVKRVYEKFGGYLRADGAQVSFELDGFRTIAARDIDRTPYAEVVSLPGKPKLQIMRIEVRDVQKAGMAVKYRSRLIVPKQLTADTWRNTVEGRSFGYAMSLATDEPQLLDARALTTFRVRRTFGEHTDTYRAAFLWLVGTADTTFRAYPVDPFSDGVDVALEERLAAAQDQPRPATKLEECLQQSKEDCSETAQCVASSSSYSSPWVYLVGGENHNTGGHSLSFQGSFECTCNSDCTARCDATPNWWCVDSQDISGLGGFHRAIGNASQDNGSTSDGRNVNVTCAAGAGCAVRQCLTETFCTLSVSVGVSRAGGSAGVSMSTSADILWGRTSGEHHTCPKCEQYTPPPPPPPPGGGGGGDDPPPPDSGGGGGWYSVDCGSDGSIDYYVYADDYWEAWDIGAQLCWGAAE